MKVWKDGINRAANSCFAVITGADSASFPPCKLRVSDANVYLSAANTSSSLSRYIHMFPAYWGITQVEMYTTMDIGYCDKIAQHFDDGCIQHTGRIGQCDRVTDLLFGWLDIWSRSAMRKPIRCDVDRAIDQWESVCLSFPLSVCLPQKEPPPPDIDTPLRNYRKWARRSWRGVCVHCLIHWYRSYLTL